MKLRIAGTDYDYAAAMQEASLNDLMRMKSQTGMGMASINRALEKTKDAGDVLDLLEDVDLLQALVCLSWLCRRHAGDDVSFEDAGRINFSDIQFIEEEDDVKPDDADPTVALTDSGQGDGSLAHLAPISG